MDTNTIEETWYGYHAKFNIKYILPVNLIVSLNNRGSDGWNPDAGTGYPYSGQAYVYVTPNQNIDPFQQLVLNLSGYPGSLSGISNVNTGEDTSPAEKGVGAYTFLSGTTDPSLGSSWYQVQSGTNLSWQIPKNQVPGIFASGINVSGNSIYSTGSNSQFSSFQINGTGGKYQLSIQSGTTINSGTSNVPYSESSWNV